jgi:putative metalloprotease
MMKADTPLLSVSADGGKMIPWNGQEVMYRDVESSPGKRDITALGIGVSLLRYLGILFCLAFLPGCENTDVMTATDAGRDALKALTLSDEGVQEIASQSARYSDNTHNLATPENRYAKRLAQLVGQSRQDGSGKFNYGVYLSPEVNAFAMADGTIRIYSGLMDMLDDGELCFVIGHEMGHVTKNHIRKKIQLAYAASAVRKGIASQNNAAGDAARSLFGGLAESLMNAQFSQLEEKEADDYGLAFLKSEKVEPRDAVSALKKIAQLGKGHSFLSSHPDPDKRAERLQAQLEGRALSIEENKQDIIGKVNAFFENIFPSFFR